MRSWLTGAFYTAAFTVPERDTITSETVYFQHYYGNWTYNSVGDQKIYLLSGTALREGRYGSRQQIKTAAYGFSTSDDPHASRVLTQTDYAASQNSGAIENAWHTTTVSPAGGANRTEIVSYEGQVTTGSQEAKAGVAPAIHINLANVLFASSVPYANVTYARAGMLGNTPIMTLRFTNSNVMGNGAVYIRDADNKTLTVMNAYVTTGTKTNVVLGSGSIACNEI